MATILSRGGKKKRRASQPTPDAIAFLTAEHAEVAKMVAEFHGSQSPEKKELALEICRAVAVHARIEEEIFYPAVARALKAEGAGLVAEARIEHEAIAALISKVETTPATDELFEPAMKVLTDYVSHHVEEEEGAIFSKARSADIDLVKVGKLLAARKVDLTPIRTGKGLLDRAKELLMPLSATSSS